MVFCECKTLSEIIGKKLKITKKYDTFLYDTSASVKSRLSSYNYFLDTWIMRNIFVTQLLCKCFLRYEVWIVTINKLERHVHLHLRFQHILQKMIFVWRKAVTTTFWNNFRGIRIPWIRFPSDVRKWNHAP